MKVKEISDSKIEQLTYFENLKKKERTNRISKYKSNYRNIKINRISRELSPDSLRIRKILAKEEGLKSFKSCPTDLLGTPE